MFFSGLEDSLMGVGKEQKRELVEKIVTVGLLPHPDQVLKAVREARERQKKDSPLHRFFLDSEVIIGAFVKRLSKCGLNIDKLIALGVKNHLLEKIYISLCPNSCFLEMASKPFNRCSRCNEKTTVFLFYRVEKEILIAWRDNMFFEAWAYSLLKREGVSCEPGVELSNEITFGEIDLLVEDDKRKSIVEITKERKITKLVGEIYVKNKILGGGYKLIILHTSRINKRLKKAFKDISILDDAYSDRDFNKKFLMQVQT